MIKHIAIAAALIGTAGLAGCNAGSNVTSLTSAICTDAAAVAASPLALNANEKLALQGLLNGCSQTAQGTVVNDLTILNAIIADAVLLQQSGLLQDVKLLAEVSPAQARPLQHLRIHAEQLRHALHQ